MNRYDPYARVLLREQYDHAGMQQVRRRMVQRAQQPGQTWGLVLGTLGRQGNPHTFDRLHALLQRHSIPHLLVQYSLALKTSSSHLVHDRPAAGSTGPAFCAS